MVLYIQTKDGKKENQRIASWHVYSCRAAGWCWDDCEWRWVRSGDGGEDCMVESSCLAEDVPFGYTVVAVVIDAEWSLEVLRDIKLARAEFVLMSFARAPNAGAAGSLDAPGALLGPSA